MTQRYDSGEYVTLVGKLKKNTISGKYQIKEDEKGTFELELELKGYKGTVQL